VSKKSLARFRYNIVYMNEGSSKLDPIRGWKTSMLKSAIELNIGAPENKRITNMKQFGEIFYTHYRKVWLEVLAEEKAKPWWKRREVTAIRQNLCRLRMLRDWINSIHVQTAEEKAAPEETK
jgi:hypothetical protein